MYHTRKHGEKTLNSYTPKECARCRSVIYCSRECQKEDWEEYHRYECEHMSRDSAGRFLLYFLSCYSHLS